jgi:hypothetical protein
MGLARFGGICAAPVAFRRRNHKTRARLKVFISAWSRKVSIGDEGIFDYQGSQS